MFSNLQSLCLTSKFFNLLYAGIARGADKFSAFPVFLFVAHSKEYFLDGLKKLKQQTHKSEELRMEYVE
jgi:hypothetical protein